MAESLWKSSWLRGWFGDEGMVYRDLRFGCMALYRSRHRDGQVE